MADYIMTMVTTIQVSEKLVTELKSRKVHEKESYEEIIWDLLEDSLELSEETKRHIAEAEADILAGRTIPLASVKKRLSL